MKKKKKKSFMLKNYQYLNPVNFPFVNPFLLNTLNLNLNFLMRPRVLITDFIILILQFLTKKMNFILLNKERKNRVLILFQT